MNAGTEVRCRKKSALLPVAIHQTLRNSIADNCHCAPPKKNIGAVFVWFQSFTHTATKLFAPNNNTVYCVWQPVAGLA